MEPGPATPIWPSCGPARRRRRWRTAAQRHVDQLRRDQPPAARSPVGHLINDHRRESGRWSHHHAPAPAAGSGAAPAAINDSGVIVGTEYTAQRRRGVDSRFGRSRAAHPGPARAAPRPGTARTATIAGGMTTTSSGRPFATTSPRSGCPRRAVATVYDLLNAGYLGLAMAHQRHGDVTGTIIDASDTTRRSSGSSSGPQANGPSRRATAAATVDAAS